MASRSAQLLREDDSELVSVVVHELAKKEARILVALEIPDLLNGDISDFVAGKTKVDGCCRRRTEIE